MDRHHYRLGFCRESASHMTGPHVVVDPDEIRFCRDERLIRRVYVFRDVFSVVHAVAAFADASVHTGDVAVSETERGVSEILRVMSDCRENVYPGGESGGSRGHHPLPHDLRAAAQLIEGQWRVNRRCEQRDPCYAAPVFSEHLEQLVEPLTRHPVFISDTY